MMHKQTIVKRLRFRWSEVLSADWCRFLLIGTYVYKRSQPTYRLQTLLLQKAHHFLNRTESGKCNVLKCAGVTKLCIGAPDVEFEVVVVDLPGRVEDEA